MKNTVLLLIDFQNDYFPTFDDAKWKLNGTEIAAANGIKLLEKFRQKSMDIVHVKHEFLNDDAPLFIHNSIGAKIHESVLPKEGEYEVLKNEVNAFKGTKLKEILEKLNTENIIIVGAMTHVCIDSAVRAASDYGYNCYVAHDACATLDLEFNGIKIPSEMAHASFMAALEFAYAKVQSTDSILELL